jgi:thiol:disulfide interchange protein
MSEASSNPRPRRRLAGGVLFLLVLAVLAMLVIPVWLIRPFAPQTPDGLTVAYLLRRWAPLGTILALIAGLGITIWLWRGARWWSRTATVLGIVVLAAATWGARQADTLFEKMFAPLATTASMPAAEADWVKEGDTVLAVALNGDAAAYPVRQVSYHHIVHDEVGGVPIVATY